LTSYQYDDANRLTSVNAVSYTWDNNGNLLNDGVNTYTYDSANRLKTLNGQGNNVTYSYNGLGDRLRETVNGNPTTFTMDFNAGLTQALSDGTNTYIYGVGRIAQVNTTTEYFLGDALSSVRQLTNTGGAITYAKAYDPYGVVTSTAGSSQSSYGYTSEFTSQGLVNLRARMYAPGMGRFLTRDSWMGDYNRPRSLNRWMYGYGNPVNYTDPSGKTPAANGEYPRHCQSMPTKAEYETCVLRFFGLESTNNTRLGETVTGSAGCYTGPSEFRAPGYIEGLSYVAAGGSISHMWGFEIVYDFATMQRQNFEYEGTGTVLSVGISDAQYYGTVKGFNTSVLEPQKYNIINDYSGIFINTNGGINVGLGSAIVSGVNDFYSPSQPEIRGETLYVGGSVSTADLGVSVDAGNFTLNYVAAYRLPARNYFLGDGSIDLGALTNDIRSGEVSPLLWFGGVTPGNTQVSRIYQANQAFKYVFAYQALRYQKVLGW
jgi:RHS repeat-associated protein